MTTKTPKKALKSDSFTAEEKAAMRERARELKAAKADGEADLLSKIAEMSEPDRLLAQRVHALVKQAAPTLKPRTWYGMPAWATAGKDGKVVCFFQAASKFKTRYATLGFSDAAPLDDGSLWPTAYALTKLDADTEARITVLIQKAAS